MANLLQTWTRCAKLSRMNLRAKAASSKCRLPRFPDPKLLEEVSEVPIR